MEDNLNLEVTEKNSNRPQLDERLISLKGKLQEEYQRISSVLYRMDNDPEFLVFKGGEDLSNVEINFFDLTDYPSLTNLDRWISLKSQTTDKDEIMDYEWEDEWYDFVRDNLGNYDSSYFDFMKDDWRYEIDEENEREIITRYFRRNIN